MGGSGEHRVRRGRIGEAMEKPVATRRPVRVDPLLALPALIGVAAVAGLGLGGAGFGAQVGAFWPMMGGVHLAFAVCAVKLARSSRGPVARLWRCAVIAGTALTAGDVVQVVQWFDDPLAVTGVAGSTVQMALLGGSMLALLYGLLRLPTGVTGAGARFRLRLDVATVMAGATTFGVWVFLPPTGGLGWSWAFELVTAMLLEPGLFLLVIFAVVRMVLSGQSPVTRAAGAALGLAAAMQAVLQAVPIAEYTAPGRGPWLLAGNVVASALLAVGARIQLLRGGAAAPVDARPRRPYSVLPYGAMAATWALTFGVLVTRGLDWHSWVVMAGAMTTTALVVGRQVAAFRHIAELLRERDRLTARLTELAFHDALTGLPNRALFRRRLTEALAAGPVTVFLADLDGFKPVNDAYGHAAGDRLLAEVGARLRGAVRSGDTVARLGGDEFAVLIEGAAGDRLPVLAAALHGTVRIGERDVPLRASIGMAHGSGDPDRLLHEADMQMYAMKRGTVAA